MLKEQLRAQQKSLKKRSTDDSDDPSVKKPKWHSSHLQEYLKQSLRASAEGQPQSTSRPSAPLLPSPWVAMLTDREREVLQELSFRRKMLAKEEDVFGQVIDLSQSLERQAIARGTACPCVTPGAKLWHIDRQRPILGVERLALQGLQFPSAKLATVPQDLQPGSQIELSSRACCSATMQSSNAQRHRI